MVVPFVLSSKRFRSHKNVSYVVLSDLESLAWEVSGDGRGISVTPSSRPAEC